MAIQYIVKAEIVDIRTDTPNSNDVFLVDSNVWFWMTYPNAGQNALHYQMNTYPHYVNNALGVGAKIHQVGLSLAELAHQIEKTEHDIYKSSVKPIKLKEYRHNLHPERSRIVSEVEASWAQVKSIAKPLDVIVDDPTTNLALFRFKTQEVDGYDLFILESMEKNGITQVITDDGDYATVPGIQVFTANRSIINSAQAQGKLIRR